MIDTGLRYFGQKILLESSGRDDVDKALKSTFKDDYQRTAPLRMEREDCQIVCKWLKEKDAGNTK